MSKEDNPYRHLIRLIGIIICLVVAFIVVRFIFVPKDYGQFGHYRGSSVKENMDRPIQYADHAVCQDCHEEIYKTWNGGEHRTQNCQNCHGALQSHTEDPTTIKPKKINGLYLCVLCHARRVSRPYSFPQIDLNQHNVGEACMTCHNPHSPGMK